MKFYVKGMRSESVKEAISLVNEFAQKKVEDESLSLDERLSWKLVYAFPVIAAVAVIAQTKEQCELIDTELKKNGCGYAGSYQPCALQ
ncbi:TPA: hypothetical protein DCZ39_08060 [Patescibacteria group bacterium]|nr:hypothetical protein [Candidatus Gracilibacteria bacterium]